MDLEVFEARKRDHLQLALADKHQAMGFSGLEAVHLIHEALPELNFEEVSLEAPCLGLALPTPFFISGMTAGHADAQAINDAFALACERRGWAMGLGSQRRDLVQLGEIDSWIEFRRRHPKLTLFSNLGVSQLIETPLASVARLLEQVQAQGLVIHANALQELIQPEGTPRFKGAFQKLAEACRTLPVPVILKETGCGFSESTLKRVSSIGLGAVDVSGLGGTHWGRIEGARQAVGSISEQAALTFRHWGESTASSIWAAKRAIDRGEIWASGGIRSGLDAAKAIALGAHRVGYAQPALRAHSDGNLEEWMKQQEFELKVALFCTGCRNIEQLRGNEDVCKITRC